MKNPILIIIASLLFASCQSNSDKTELIANDTIRTGSGLQYYYIKKGEGRKIEDDCMVAAYNRLYLNDVDTIFWESVGNEDSTFNFIQGKTSLIKGALELYPLLREGDEVVAIMPDSIAYGKEDRNGLPGGSTLIFNPIKIKSVSEPKKSLNDTLYAIYQSGSVTEMFNTYQSIANSSLKDEYHMGFNLLNELFNRMTKDEKYEDVVQTADMFEQVATTIDDKQSLWYMKINATALLGDTTRAITLLEEVIIKDPSEPYWNTMLYELKKQ